MTLLWYLGGFVAAIAVGWLAAMLHVAGFAPLGLVSLGVGSLLGMVLSFLMAITGIRFRMRLMVGCFVMAMVTVLAEHAWLYREFRRQWHEDRASSSEVALLRPETPWSAAEYFGRESTAGRLGLWLVDAMLIFAGALIMVVTWERRRRTFGLAADAQAVF
jgi:hypothetical protein